MIFNIIILNLLFMISNPFFVCPFTKLDNSICKNTKYYVAIFDKEYDEIFKELLTESEYDNIIDKVKIYEGNKKLLDGTMKYHSNTIYIKNKDKIPNIENECLMTVIIDNDIKQYINITHEDSIVETLKDILKVISIGDKTEKELMSLIRSKMNMVKDINYWQIFDNCKSNSTYYFVKRKFDLSKIKVNKTIVSDNYFDEIEKKSNEMASTIKKERSGNRERYTIDEYPNVKNVSKYTQAIFKICSRNNYQFIIHYIATKLIATKHYWHLIMNDTIFKEFILENISGDGVDLYRIVLYYAMKSAHFEELAFKKKININSRSVFTLDNKFPTCYCKLQSSPYFPFLVSGKREGCDFKSNLNGPYGITNDYLGCVNNVKQFEQRIAIFNPVQKNNLEIIRDNPKSIFDGMKYVVKCDKCEGENCTICHGNGEYTKVSLVGSLISFALPKRHPHLDLFEGVDDVEKLWRFMKEYYNKSDQDVMVYSDSINDFISFTYSEIIPVIYNNLSKNNKNMKVEDLVINDEYYVNIIIDEKFLIYLENTYHVMTCNYMKENINKNDVKNHIYEFAQKYSEIPAESYYSSIELDQLKIKITKNFKEENMEKKKKSIIMEEKAIEKIKLFGTDEEKSKLVDELDTVITDDGPDDLPANIDDSNLVEETSEIKFLCKILGSFKVKVYSKYMERNLEIFRIPTSNMIGKVSTFHVACVRAYYNGENVYMTPSCLFAMHTRINIDYNYFTSKTSPTAILIKYLQRGFGTMLNVLEKKQIRNDLCNDPIWRSMKGTASKNFFMNYLKYDSPFLRPRTTCPELFKDNFEQKYNNTAYGIDRYVQHNYAMIRYNYLTVINEKGFMRTLSPMMIEYFDDWIKLVKPEI